MSCVYTAYRRVIGGSCKCEYDHVELGSTSKAQHIHFRNLRYCCQRIPVFYRTLVDKHTDVMLPPY